jgi:hypothetical protein
LRISKRINDLRIKPVDARPFLGGPFSQQTTKSQTPESFTRRLKRGYSRLCILATAGRSSGFQDNNEVLEMNKNIARRFFSFVVFAIGAAASGIVYAQTTTSYPVSATCSGGGQLCNNVATVPITTTGLLQAQFVGGGALCSNIRIHFIVDGTEVAVTGFVGAGGSTGVFNLGPVSSGSHVLGLQAEGQVGGCNSGALGSWSGTAQVTTNGAAVASQSIPTLSEWGIVLLLALLGFFGMLHTPTVPKRGPRQ